MTPAQAKRQSLTTLNSLARRVAARASWNTLSLPATQRSVLRTLITQERKAPDTGSSVLLAGSAGADKSRAAQVLARELQRKLYRVDQAALFSKYIGESEKNLDRLLAAAEASGAILLFDEADALFGKRTDVKDSHDRYANIEVSYVLQRMKAHSGLVLIAAQGKASLDDTFKRRLRYAIDFQPPD